MVRVNSVFSKFLYLVVLVIVLKYNDVRSALSRSDFNLLNFEQIKNDLFARGDFSTLNSKKCLKELASVAESLLKSEEWAMKLLDAWGHLPSGLFSGNFHEFGEFEQCFNIKRNGELYETQYCLGHLSFNATDWLQQESHRHIKQFLDAPNIVQPRNLRGLTPQFNTGPGFTFGVCIPSDCSLDMLEPIINKLIHEKTKNVSITFDKNTCQFEEIASNLRTLDKVTFFFLGIIFSLVVASTSYDIIYTITKSEKSQVFLAFSFYTNGRKLLSYKESKSPDMLNCLHGIRAISTQWVVLGHTFFMYLLLPLRNLITVPSYFAEYHAMIIASGPISVDTFFVISGLLVSLNMLKHLEKSNGKINVPLMYLHRYLRLTPLLAATILICMSLLRFIGSGPLYPGMVEFFYEQCVRNWYTTLLYVQNYANPDDICLGHTWYLAVDMQLFLISPVVIYLLYKLRIKLMPVLFLMVLGCIGCTVAIHLKYELTSLLNEKKMPIAYFPTHVRFSSWLIGVIAGYFFFEARKKSVYIPKLFNLFAWTLSLVLMVIVIFINYPLMQLDSTATPLEYGLYDALSRVAWSIAVCYIIFACVHNHGGFVNRFLSHPLWQPISRLSYSIYLMHLLVIMVTSATLKAPLYFSELNAIHSFIGNYVITIFVSIIATLAFESPVIVIEKFIFGSTNKPDTTVSNEQSENLLIQPEISYEHLEDSTNY